MFSISVPISVRPFAPLRQPVDIVKCTEVLVQANTSFMGVFFKCARIGERLSPYVSLACLAMAVTMLR